jgi:hypothetical protein
MGLHLRHDDSRSIFTTCQQSGVDALYSREVPFDRSTIILSSQKEITMKIRILLALLSAGACITVAACSGNAVTAPDSNVNTGRNPKSPGVSHEIVTPRDPQSGLPTGKEI